MLTDGVDFVLAECGGRPVGRKAMAVNLSDIAAMAGRPVAAVVSVALPVDGTRHLAEELTHGLREVADRFGVAIVGGDTNVWDGGLVISVTAFGEATGRGPVPRSGALPGDWIFVTGPVGGSLLGRHLDPTPRVNEALRLHAAHDLHAMIDISDGLAADLHHILAASGCGAALASRDIPVHPDAVARAATTGQTPLQHALGDGEDFELIVVVPPADGERLRQAGLAKIGECVPGSGMTLDGKPLEPTGWVHRVS